METEITFTDAQGKQRTLTLPILPSAIAIAELCLLPAFLFAFALGHPLMSLIAELGGSPTRLGEIAFLKSQSVFLASKGIDPSSVAADFQVWGLFVYITAAIALLRLGTAPLLFDFWNGRAISLKTRYVPASPEIILLGGLVAGPLALWASISNGATFVPSLAALLNHSPRVYIFLESFVFVGGLIFATEWTVLALLLVLKQWMPRLSNPYEVD